MIGKPEVVSKAGETWKSWVPKIISLARTSKCNPIKSLLDDLEENEDKGIKIQF